MFFRPSSNLLVPFMQPQFRRGRAAAGGGGPTLLVDENFEGTGTPSGWFSGSADFDYSAAALAGSQSLRVSGSQTPGVLDGGALNHGELWGKFLYNPEALPTSFTRIANLRDSGFNYLLEIYILSTGILRLSSGGTIFTDTADAVSAGSTYRVYWRYKKGTGANQIAELGFAITDARPTTGNKFAGGSNGTGTANGTQLFFESLNSSIHVIDNVQVAATTFN